MLSQGEDRVRLDALPLRVIQLLGRSTDRAFQNSISRGARLQRRLRQMFAESVPGGAARQRFCEGEPMPESPAGGFEDASGLACYLRPDVIAGQDGDAEVCHA